MQFLVGVAANDPEFDGLAVIGSIVVSLGSVFLLIGIIAKGRLGEHAGHGVTPRAIALWEHPGMDVPGNAPLFWITLTVTLTGAVLTLTATGVLARRAVRSRRDLRSRIAAGRAAAAATVARSENQRVERTTASMAARQPDVLTEDGAPQVRMTPDVGRESADRIEENARFEKEFKEGVGRPMSEYTFADGMLVPELIALMITEDQIDELKLPAVLVALGVLTSTVGSVLSLWV